MPSTKTRLHPRNRNREPYDLAALVAAVPELAQYVGPNRHGNDSVDFRQPAAVRLLNQALIHHYYGVQHWTFPTKNLTPPVPGRADYLHHLADLLRETNYGNLPESVRALDVGTGASCIYPLLGVVEYNWSFVATDTDAASLEAARVIVNANPQLSDQIELRHQPEPEKIFTGVVQPEDEFLVSLCNPPFHASAEEARAGTQRKMQNLTGQATEQPVLNFAGTDSELVYPGGEYTFIRNMIWESQRFGKQIRWFSSLVSKKSHLRGIERTLDRARVRRKRVIPMGTGNKSTRIVAWSFTK